MSDKWYLIRYKHNKIKIVIASLALLDIQYLLPKAISYDGDVRDHNKNNERPKVCYHISPYMFVKIPDERNLFQKVRYSPGVDNFVKFLGHIYPIHGKTIEKAFDIEHMIASTKMPFINISNEKNSLVVNCYLNDIETQMRREKNYHVSSECAIN
ncbi:hypothetical protein KCK33_003523 [Salmonella enterica]|nr:hypothetical protein [Salmonella enterica]EGA0603432.1 hypothetical protein [Salmonella enterica]EHD2148902.1 hypothetical protein [Salmonella enterica]EHK2353391.1 hypothetical protein [Salmonella enterica]